MMDYVVVSVNVAGRLMDVRVFRGEREDMSDHHQVEGKLQISMRWIRAKQAGVLWKF